MHDPERLASEVVRRAGARRLLLLLDFDGTLCEFEADPAAVRLPAQRRDLLVRLTQAIAIGVVSGRRLADVRDRCGVDGIAVAGMHGLEIEGFGERFVHPDLEKAFAAIDEATPLLRDVAEPLPGAFVEEKGASVALHFRESNAPAQQAAIEGFSVIAEPYAQSGRLRVMRGSNVLELLPNIDWNKGHAVRWLYERAERHLGPTFPAYIGDDVTDQDALTALESDGFPIAASDRVTASARLDGPPQVEQFLRSLADRI